MQDAEPQLFKNERDFWSSFKVRLPNPNIFEDEFHADIDFSLVEKIDALVVPISGDYENNDASWFHNLDVYGDGVRSLEFTKQAFPRSLVKGLQHLLVDEHAPFCVLVRLYKSIQEYEPKMIGCLAIFSDIVFEFEA